MKKVLVLVVSLLFFGCVSTEIPKSSESGIYTPASEPVPAPEAMVIPEAQVAYPEYRNPPKSGMGGIGRVVIGGGDIHSNVYSHSYRVLNSLTEVQRLKNTITYVILPDNISAQRNGTSKKYKRYSQLLELIQELRKTDLSVPTDSIEAKSDNQFVLFSKDEKEKNVDVKNYNYELAHKVLDFFKKNYSYSLFSKEGPYLVTVTKDVWTDKNDFTFLYVNMSSFNNSALKEVLESYKERLITKGNDEVSMFEKLHATLLSFITNLNDDIHIFQSAFAGEL